MRIGIVTTWFDRGAAYVSRQLMDSLKGKAEVFIYARGEKYERGNPFWDLDCVHWGYRDYWPGSGRIDKDDFLEWIRSNEIDLIIFNEQRWWEPLLWCKDVGVKVGAYIDYYTEHDIACFLAYDFLICNTARHYSLFKGHPGAIFIKWGTDTDLFSPRKKGEVNASGSRPLVFFHSAGMAPYRKGTDLVVAAFNSVKHQIDAKLIIHSQVNLPGVRGDNIELVTGTVAPPGLYHMGDVYVYPSRLDGIGLTVCEALACGKPVITSTAQPMSEFVEHLRTGYLVPVAKEFKRDDEYYWPIAEVSVDGLASAMLRCFDERGETLEEMSQCARVYAVKERDWNKNASALWPALLRVESKPLLERQVKALKREDSRGWQGKLDTVHQVKWIRRGLNGFFWLYRAVRQPHVYAPRWRLK